MSFQSFQFSGRVSAEREDRVLPFEYLGDTLIEDSRTSSYFPEAGDPSVFGDGGFVVEGYSWTDVFGYSKKSVTDSYFGSSIAFQNKVFFAVRNEGRVFQSEEANAWRLHFGSDCFVPKIETQ